MKSVTRKPALPRWLCSAVLVILSAALLAWTFQTARALGMAESLPVHSFTRAEMSIAVAISRLVYGARGYVLYGPVVGALIEGGFKADTIAKPGQINRAIDRARRVQFVADCNVPRTCAPDWGDDKGYADFAILAFWLFGFRIEAFYYLYFLLLALSLAAFAAEFFHEPGRLLFMPLFLSAHHITVTILPNSMVTFVLHDARFLPALSTLAALHLGLVAMRPTPPSGRTITLAACQMAVIVLAIDGRASAKWQVAFVAVLAAVGIVRTRSIVVGRTRVIVGKLTVVALVAVGVVGLHVYKQLAYDDRYLTDGIPSHVVWHNIYMGFGIHPDAVTRFDLNPTDATSYRHAHRFLQKHPAAGRDLGIDASHVNYPVFADVGWRRYDEVVRAMYFRFWRDHPGYALQTYIVYKPKYLLQQVLWQTGLKSNFPRWVAVDDVVLPVHRTAFNLLQPAVAGGVAVAVVTAAAATGVTIAAEWLVVGSVLFVASLIPSVLVAPLYYELPPVFLALGIFCYATIAAAFVGIVAGVLPQSTA